MARVLVTFATKHGSTARIAEKIANVLEAAGHVADLLPVRKASADPAYQAVVLGSAVYAGQWLREAVAFLDRHQNDLRRIPTWFFSSGPTGEGNPVSLLGGWRFPQGQIEVAHRIGPRDMAVFHGNLQPSLLNLPERMIVKGIKAPIGDFRDWAAIETWATEIATSLGN